MIKSSTKNIILIGMMGSGKSTTAKKIAEQTFLSHLDTDELISAYHQKSIQDIFDAFGEKQFREIIYSDEYKEMKNVKIKGLMAMASNTNEKSIIRSEFVHAKKIFDEINNGDKSFEILSMGMSNDYKIAIESGSNMIRLGSLIFGERNY